MLDKAFDALKTYNWGDDRKVLAPIDDAIVKSHGDDSARKELETKLTAVLESDVSHDAKDFVCRKLRAIGTASCVPVLAKLLAKSDMSHLARYALERIPVAEAGKALRDALPNLESKLKIGVLSSLGTRQEAESVPAIAACLAEADASVASSAAFALGAIQSADAATALAGSKASDARTKLAVTDASLACAESLLSAGKKIDALGIYKRLVGEADQPKHVRLAATRGMLACAGKSAAGAQQ